MNLFDFEIIVKNLWRDEAVKLREDVYFLSFLIEGVRVDFVIDPMSIQGERYKFRFEAGNYLMIDFLENIVSNKLCAIAGRSEIKDFIDFYFAFKRFPELDFDMIYEIARLKDAIFDDPPSAGYLVEHGFKEALKQPLPYLDVNIDMKDFKNFYLEVARKIYNKLKI